MTAALLSVEEMYRADALAMTAGVSGPRLMEAAGFAVAAEVHRRFDPCRVVVVCGPGNNGGDGFAAARHLAAEGFQVRVALLGALSALEGDAAAMAKRWDGEVAALEPAALDDADLVVDALFGAGLSRPLAGLARDVVDEVIRRDLPVVAVDVPSGVDGNTGAVLGAAARAAATVTFFRKKPGHLLHPGRALCGDVVVADIGIPAEVLATIMPLTAENTPANWLPRFPWPCPEGHKYARGHALVVGGAEMTGAARLAARAARRAGAGLVSIAAPDSALAVYRAGDPGTIVVAMADFEDLLADPRRNAVLLGPGGGIGEAMRRHVGQALGAGKVCVLDADAVSAFADTPKRLFNDLGPHALLTPHDGEFRRLFPAIAGSRLDRARAAAKLSGAVVLLKGPDTVVAHPDGRAAINANAPPWLATAGSGDVLAGIALGLMAAGMEAFDAGSAAAWLHGEAATRFGAGLIAEDLPDSLPAVLAELDQGRGGSALPPNCRLGGGRRKMP